MHTLKIDHTKKAQLVCFSASFSDVFVVVVIQLDLGQQDNTQFWPL